MNSQKKTGRRSRYRPYIGKPMSAPSASPHSQPAATLTRMHQGCAAARLPGRQSSCPAHMCSTTHVSLLWRSSPWGTALLSMPVLSVALAIKRKFLDIEFTVRKKLYNSWSRGDLPQFCTDCRSLGLSAIVSSLLQ